MTAQAATWADVALKIIGIFEPFFPWVIGLLLLWALVRVTDLSVIGTIREVLREFVAIVQGPRINPRSVNAMGGVLLFALAIFLYFEGLAHIAIPTTPGSHPDHIGRIISGVVLFFFGLYFILSILVSRYQR